jgi:uncharacterized protein YutE (UPF0331/DUF86 family)/predicted nucleotidyltransferase
MQPEIKAKLQRYAEGKDNILLAFIFGSEAKGLAGEDSDLDIAVFLKDKDEENNIWLEISRITDREIDLIILNDAPATLVSNIFKTGKRIAVKDKKLYWDLFLANTMEAEDFSEFAQEYWKIYSRSRSLIPEDKVRLLERINFLTEEFKEIEGFENLSFKEYREDKLKRRNIERWTENVINATIDIAKITLASEKKEMPKTYEQALSRFGNFMGLGEKETEELAFFARLRNILAHEYLDVLYDRINKFIKDSPPLYRHLFDFLSKYV